MSKTLCDHWGKDDDQQNDGPNIAACKGVSLQQLAPRLVLNKATKPELEQQGQQHLIFKQHE